MARSGNSDVGALRGAVLVVVAALALLRTVSASPSLNAAGGVAGGMRAPRSQEDGRPQLRVTMVLTDPYVMLREPKLMEIETQQGDDNDTALVEVTEEVLEGNDRYEGFSVDLLHLIADLVDIDYDLTVTADGKHGSFDPHSQQWTGMIGDLIAQRADVAIGDLTVTDSRRSVVQFTYPWLTSGIGLLTYRDLLTESSCYTLLLPFNMELWIYILITCVAFFLVLFIVARISPMEREPLQPEQCRSQTVFSCCNSLWFAFATLLRQFTIIQPRAASTRILTGVWWLFVLAIVTAYIANLSSIFTLRAMASQQRIKSIYDLPKQDSMSYTAMYGGSTWAFLRDSQSETMQRIFSNIRREATNAPRIGNYAEGVEYVLNNTGRAAFFMELQSIDYIRTRNCDLQRLPGIIGESNYALALDQDSDLIDAFNDALLWLRGNGTVRFLHNKWWHHKRGGGQCYSPNYEEGPAVGRALQVSNMLILWLVLAVGAVLAIVLSLLECCCRSFENARTHDSGLCTEVGDQVRGCILGPATNSGGFDVTGA